MLKSCIRGLQDTDGSIYPQKNSKIILDISITSDSLIKSVIEAFERIGLPVNNTSNRIYLCGEKPILSFFQNIGSSNHKHIIKYKTFLETKKVPLSKEIESLLKLEKTPEIEVPYHGLVV